MLLRNQSLALLFTAQALYWGCTLIGITLTALIGLQLAPLNVLATLPLALLVLSNLLVARPLSLFMQRRGRRPGLLLGAGCGVVGGLLSALGVWLGDFVIFCLGALPLGAYQASAMYYRFAAMEAVGEAHRGRAAAYVIGGGICAALVTPSLALVAQNALDTPFVGAYLLIAGLASCALLLVARLREGTPPMPADHRLTAMATLLRRPPLRAAIATTAIGHGLMILVMNATALAMQSCGLPLAAGAQVIQWHMLGMFLPAFVAGPLVDRLGSLNVAVLGSLVLLASASVALTGLNKGHFLASSFLLGLGWNLMMVAGTTLLAAGHSEAERGNAQGLMELGNGSVAATASFASGALLGSFGWGAVNLGILPMLALALVFILPLRRSAPGH